MLDKHNSICYINYADTAKEILEVNKMTIVKAGNVQLTAEEAKRCYEEKLYVCSYTGIYQPFYSVVNDKYYFHKVIEHKGYARRGRFYIQNAEQINHVFGKKILIED